MLDMNTLRNQFNYSERAAELYECPELMHCQ